MSENAQATADHGHMDIHEQKDTFHHFIQFGVWAGLHVVMGIALLTITFAMGAGWFMGLAAFVVIGALAGLFLRLGGAWWAALIVEAALLGIGGAIVGLAVH